VADYLGVAEACAEMERRYGLNVRPQDVSNAFYRRWLPGERCPIVGGRRLIPRDCLPAISAALGRRMQKKPNVMRKMRER